MEVSEWVTEQRNFSKYFYSSPNISDNYPSSNRSSVSDFSEYNGSVINKTNLNTLPLVCGFCDYRCKLNIQLNFHRTTHIKKDNVPISNCESKTANTLEKSLKIAEKTESLLTTDHVNSRIICDVCSYECFLVIQLMIHKRVRHGDGVSFLSYADKELRSDDNFEKAILNYFLKPPKDAADREDAVVIKISEEQNPNVQKVDVPVKSGRKKVACKYCEFTCQLFIQLQVHKKRYHEKRARKTSVSRHISKEDESFQSGNAGETRNEINSIDCIVVNDEMKNLQEEKKGGAEIESSGKENEINNINAIINAVPSEAIEEDYAVSQNTKELFKEVSSKLESFVNSGDNKLNFNYQSSRKRKKKARHEHDKRRKEENCSKVKNVTMCTVDIKESEIQLNSRKPLQDSSKESKNDNLTFSCSHCTYKCKFSVELRIHENIHRAKSFVIRPVPMNSYGDNIARRIPNCAIKDNDFDMTGNNKDGVLKLAKISQGDPVMKIKNKKIHRDVSNKKVSEKIDSMKVNGIFLTTDSMFSCSECNYKCNFEAQLRLHRSVLHGKDKSRQTSSRVESKSSKTLPRKCYILLQDSDKLAVKTHIVKQKAQKLKTDLSVDSDERKLSSNGCHFKCKLPNQLSVHKNDKRYDKNVPQIKKNDHRKNVVKFITSPLKHKSYHSGRNIFAF